MTQLEEALTASNDLHGDLVRVLQNLCTQGRLAGFVVATSAGDELKVSSDMTEGDALGVVHELTATLVDRPTAVDVCDRIARRLLPAN